MTDFINMANKSNSKFLESNMFSITKIILFPLMLFILAVASGCNSADGEGGFSTSSNDLILLQNAKAKWDSQSPQFYTIQSHRSCECEDELSTQMNVSVSDNLVLSAIDIDTDEVISKEVQEKRFNARIANPLKRWKFSPVDKKGQELWDKYTTYKEQMFAKTHTAYSPWILVKANDKKTSRLESMRYVLSQFKYDGKDEAMTTLHPDPNIVTRYFRSNKQID